MRFPALLSLLLLPTAVWAQHPMTGTFSATQACEAYQSFRKQTNPEALKLTVGETYEVKASNKAEGDWYLLSVNKQTRWVAKSCGQLQAAGATVEPEQTGKPAEQVTSPSLPNDAKFDYYTLAMSWHSGFCNGKTRPDCRNAKGDFVLHGLWPSNTKGAHPAYCDGSNKQGFCKYRDLKLDGETKADLAKIMPGSQVCLDRYQWHKHGSCSGLNKADFFDLSVIYSQWLRESAAGNAFRRNAGGSVSRAAVLDWFDDMGLKNAVSLHCKEGYLEEVRLYWHTALPMDPAQAKPWRYQGQQRCPARFDLLP